MQAARISLGLLALLLAACQPVIHTDYEMVMPHSVQGKMCANQCKATHDQCSQSCQSEYQRCRRMQEMFAQSDYLSYLNYQSRMGRPALRTERDFMRRHPCPVEACEERCGTDYRTCHTGCGGKVVPHSTCTAFCN